jgi:hypothetical protein
MSLGAWSGAIIGAACAEIPLGTERPTRPEATTAATKAATEYVFIRHPPRENVFCCLAFKLHDLEKVNIGFGFSPLPQRFVQPGITMPKCRLPGADKTARD